MGLMDFYSVHIHADRRKHQYCILIPHKPPEETTEQVASSRLQQSFLTAVRPGHIDADYLSEPHFYITLSAGKTPLHTGDRKKQSRFKVDRKKIFSVPKSENGQNKNSAGRPGAGKR